MDVAPSNEDSKEAKIPSGTRLRELYDQELRVVWKFLQRLGIPTSDLDDLTQEVFMRAFRLYDRYDPSRPVRPWILGITYHAAVDFLRSRGRAATVFEDPNDAADVADEKPTPDEQVYDDQRRKILNDILATMDLDKRALLVMHELSGQTVPQIAEVLDIPLNTAYSRLRLARAQFDEAARSWRKEHSV